MCFQSGELGFVVIAIEKYQIPPLSNELGKI